jgi:hypothetical protein
MKTTLAALWSAVVLCLGLTACGGGGGNGGGNGIAAPMAADASGPALSGSPALQAPGDEEAPSLTAQTATGAALDAQAIAARLNAADARNGLYYVYAANGTNGTRQKLRVNFDTRSYTLTDHLGEATSGTFGEDPGEPGTYLFASSRITGAVNTARFRIAADAIVGAFPFEKPWSNPVSYQVTAFIAARAFVTDPAQLDGEYNRLGISLTSDGSADSQIVPMLISGKGTQLLMCFDSAIYQPEACPLESRRVYTITPGADFVWTGTNVNAPTDVLGFRMARIGGQNVALLGGASLTAPDVRPFRIALRDLTTWPTARYVGSSSDGRWGTNLLGPASTSRTSFDATGTSATLALPVNDVDPRMPQGIRLINGSGVDRYFATQNGTLAVIVGARNPGTQGYIQIGLFKDNGGVDPRSGNYQAYSTQRDPVRLTLDFDAGTYQMNEAFQQASSGTFSADSSDPGSYVFASPRIAGVVNTARFRVTDDAIVGAFPFYVSALATPPHQVQPFVAVRNLVTSQADLPGSYDLIVAGTPAALAPRYLSSSIARVVIGPDGELTKICRLTPVTTCAEEASPGAFVVSTASNQWYLFSGGGSALFTFVVANVGSHKIMLAFGRQAYGSDSKLGPYLLLGPRQPATGPATWLTGSVHSYSSAGELGALAVGPSSYGGSYQRADGTTAPFALTLGPVTNNGRVMTGTAKPGAAAPSPSFPTPTPARPR